MEYRNDLADVLLNGLPDDEREKVIATIGQVDAEKLRRIRAAGPGEGDVSEFDSDDSSDDIDDEDRPVKVIVPEQG